MIMDEKKNGTKKSRTALTPCETCTHYDVIDEDGTLGCTIDLDEDEAYHFRMENNGCPHYKFYNEYLSVRKQN